MNDNVLQSILGYPSARSIEFCKQCGKPYYQETEDQVPGFRMMDYDICPYCKFENFRSMSVEYNNTPMTEKEMQKHLKRRIQN